MKSVGGVAALSMTLQLLKATDIKKKKKNYVSCLSAVDKTQSSSNSRSERFCSVLIMLIAIMVGSSPFDNDRIRLWHIFHDKAIERALTSRNLVPPISACILRKHSDDLLVANEYPTCIAGARESMVGHEDRIIDPTNWNSAHATVRNGNALPSGFIVLKQCHLYKSVDRCRTYVVSKPEWWLKKYKDHRKGVLCTKNRT